ncbi:gibberellin receptor GID1 [Vigna unguiculata]|uniref:Gibberellin receptor GID1 n=1 Tax=Vigna unguiculata TaxID=3917 RepID=A0A4D6MPB6_VIGUN|nr:gibberellin receptor GID1 [Vigna unguiculata]
MSEAAAPSISSSAMDPFEFLKIKLNPDGSLTRNYVVPTVPPSPTPPTSEPSLSVDIPLNAATNTSFRLFLPHPPPAQKLPLILYFHGGGFILYHPSSFIFHHSCTPLAASLPAVIASVDYRLSPEHRLPAAYDDALDALLWAQDQARDPAQAHPWLSDHVDFSKCFLMGSSAGGNIAYFAALVHSTTISPLSKSSESGSQRSDSELRLVNDRILPLPANDLMWSLSLPEGTDRDHVYCNPTAADAAHGDKIGRLPACFINGYGGDPLVDKQKELARILEARGVRVEKRFVEDGNYVVPTVPPSPTPPTSEPSLSVDIPLNAAANTSLRLFLPHPPPAQKLPLIIHIHGGGFILFHPSSVISHQFCTSLAASLPAVIASVDYRLSPEHRLPAAYDDALDALLWAQAQARDPAQAHPWLRDHVDFSNAPCTRPRLSPLKILGIFMNVPYFSGSQRSDSELRLVNDRILPLPANDLMWSLSLPEGTDRDHVYCNPTAVEFAYGNKIGRLPACFINGYGGDPLVDKQKEFAKILEARGVRVEKRFVEDGYHAVEIFDETKALALAQNIKNFVLSLTSEFSK